MKSNESDVKNVNSKNMSSQEIETMMESYKKMKNRQKVQTFKDRELIRLAKKHGLHEAPEFKAAVEKFVAEL